MKLLLILEIGIGLISTYMWLSTSAEAIASSLLRVQETTIYTVRLDWNLDILLELEAIARRIITGLDL